MCKCCIDAIRSHGERIFTAPIDWWDDDAPDEEEIVCDFCGESYQDCNEEMEEVIF